ncbi:MAG: peptidase, partial [Marinilabiliales bacterium]|nr:peptidase [Marinilabiliales bacterium]
MLSGNNSFLKRFALIFLLSVFLVPVLQAQSLEEKIKSLPDVISVEKMENNPFFQEAYVVLVKQPLDHLHPERGTFPQRVFVSHLAFDRPVVFVTEGYGGGYAASKRYVEELCPILKANQIFVEHRFFGKSRPETIDWKDLSVENAAADQHHVVVLFKNIYGGKWVSTGISKGGETVLYHRTLYPADVDASVPYVAPLNFSVEEMRHPKFIEKKV